MRKRFLRKGLLWVGLPALYFTSCIDDSRLALPPVVANQSFVEEFDTVQSAYNRGWRFVNRSVPIGPTNWAQASIFVSYSSTSTLNGHIEQDALACAGTNPEKQGVLSNWIVSPAITIQNGDKIIFYTRDDRSDYVDRLQVRLNINNENLDCGRGADVGAFDKLLLDINPTYQNDPSLGGYPDSWTRFEATVSGLDMPKRGRFSFRAFMEGGGPGATELGSTIGIDSVAYVSKK